VRVFEQDYKVNFVDESDVLVGFDNSQSCCENFGWFFSDKVPGKIKHYDEDLSYEILSPSKEELEGFNFDPEFFRPHSNGSSYDVDDHVTFRLVGPLPFEDGEPLYEKQREIFLTLYNSHNGYYSHGFEVTVNGQVLHSGSL
jgi:hypothetical protein